MTDALIECTDVTKYYDGFLALDHVTLRVPSRSIYGYLGQNGAGKTTTIRILLGLAHPSAGSVRIVGTNPFREPVTVFRQVGYCPELPTLQTFLSAEQLLDLAARQTGVATAERRARIRALLELVGLWDFRGRKIGKYSKGMVQRLAMAQALVHDPVLLVLDEPTLGLDPAATVHFRDLFRQLVAQGKTLFVSSHLLDEVQRLATHVAMIHRGRIVFDGTVNDMLATFDGARVIGIELAEVPPTLVAALRALPFVREIQVDKTRLSVTLTDRADHRAELSHFLFIRGAQVLEFAERRPRLEEAYLAMLRGGPAHAT